jgi:hypothetical protein
MPEVHGRPSAAAVPSEKLVTNTATPATTAPAATPAPATGSEIPWYAVALALGAISGFAEVALGDLMLTGFLALFFCMLMGALRPARPWRWVLVVCGCIPLSRLFAADVLHIYTERAQIYEAFASFVTGNAGAYVGSLGRRRVDDLWRMVKSEKR